MSAPRPSDCYDFSQWPVVVMRPPSLRVTDAELRSMQEYFREQVIARGGVYYLVNDLTQSAGGMNASQRKMLVEEMERIEALPHVTQGCIALVFTSGLLRGMLTAVLWMRKPKSPTRTFGTVDEAVAWAKELAAAAAPATA